MRQSFAHECPHCGEHFVTHDKRKRYCSRRCGGGVGRSRIAALRARGEDPSHGGAAAAGRRASLARRRASGELLGLALVKARAEGRAPPADFRPTIVPPKAGHLEYIQYHLDTKGDVESSKEWLSKLQSSAVIIIGGFAPSLTVDKDELVATQGGTYTKTPHDRLSFSRGVHNLQAVVMLGQHGKVSVDAMRWCQVQKVGLFILDSDGELVSVTSTSPPHAVSLRRAQYITHPLPVARESSAQN